MANVKRIVKLAARDPKAAMADDLTRIDDLVVRAERALNEAKRLRTERACEATKALVEEGWDAMAAARDAARLHPATEAWVTRAAGRMLSVHEALADYRATLDAPVRTERPKLLDAPSRRRP